MATATQTSRQTRRCFQVRERATVPKTARVDRETGTIYGVRILGANSANGRRYTPEAMRNGVPLYDGVRVYLDHHGGLHPDRSRSFKEQVGVIRAPKFVNNGISGDLVIFKSDPLGAKILDAAEHAPESIGLSHDAVGQGPRVDGVDVIEKIVRVRSVDIVTDPATTRGLFESRSGRPSPDFKQVLEATDEEVNRLLGDTDDASQDLSREAALEARKKALREKLDAILANMGLDWQQTMAKIREVLNAEKFATTEAVSCEVQRLRALDDPPRSVTASEFRRVLRGGCI